MKWKTSSTSPRSRPIFVEFQEPNRSISSFRDTVKFPAQMWPMRRMYREAEACGSRTSTMANEGSIPKRVEVGRNVGAHKQTAMVMRDHSRIRHSGNMTITLVGYRGCGKSSVAPLLADRLNFGCADSDQQIENEAGMSIAQIFKHEQETGFRVRETKVLKSLLAQPGMVIAAGGGAILAEENRLMMRQAGPVVWLEAPAHVLAARIAGDDASATLRPSLTGRSVTDEVADVLTLRTPLYKAAATHRISTIGCSPAEIVEQIVEAVSGHVHPGGADT